MEEKPKIGETCVPELVKGRANRILVVYLQGTNSFDKLTNAVYVMVCAIKKSMYERSNKNEPPKENRQIVKCKQQLRELRQKVARASNEIHSKKSKQKLTEEEHSIMKTLCKQANFKLEDEQQLSLTKEKWLAKNESKKLKFQKIVQKEKSIKDNRHFERSEGRLYRSVGSTVEHTGSLLKIDKFTDFWGCIWQDDKKTTYQPWIIEVRQKIRLKVDDVREFIVS